MNDHTLSKGLLNLSDRSYSITWTSERINRLVMDNREIHLWSDFHNHNQAAGQLWSSEKSMIVTRDEAVEVIFEWVSNGPFVNIESDMSRVPDSLKERLSQKIPYRSGIEGSR